MFLVSIGAIAVLAGQQTTTSLSAKDSIGFINSLNMCMVLIHPDQFLTGTRLDRSNWHWYERAEIPRWVNIRAPFHLAAHEVTNAQYRQFVKETRRSEPKGLLLRGATLVRDFEPWEDPAFAEDRQPVVCVSYADAEAFCHWLTGKEKRNYRLPTSDEWEYACRAGWGTDYNWGNDRLLPDQANYDPFLLEADDPPGRVAMFSLEQAARLRGGRVDLSADRQRVRGMLAGRDLEVAIGKPEALVEGKAVALDVPAMLQDHRVMVPTRFLAFEVGLVFTGRPFPVGSFKPNDWGLYDMHGNVNEITGTGDTFRIVRGGGWNDSARRCRSASVRDRWKADCPMAGIGFRVACDSVIRRNLEVVVGDAVVVRSAIDKDLIFAGRTMLKLRDGTLIMQDRISKDGGRTWQPCPMQPNVVAAQLSDGTVLSVPFIVPRDVSKPEGWGRARCLRSTDGWKTVTSFEAAFHVPDAMGGFDDGGTYRDAIGYCDHDMVELASGDVLMTMYGFWKSARILSDYQRYPIETQQWKYVAWVVKSSDKGMTWHCLSRSIWHPELTRGGGCELGLVRLAGDRLLMGARTGEHGYPNERMLFVWSSDQGRTWGEGTYANVDGRPLLGIYPQFALMSNGILAMTWGRTGDAATAVAFSVDGSGKAWSDFTSIPDDLGGYNDIVETEPGTLMISSSKIVNGVPDLRVVRVKVNPRPE